MDRAVCGVVDGCEDGYVREVPGFVFGKTFLVRESDDTGE